MQVYVSIKVRKCTMAIIEEMYQTNVCSLFNHFLSSTQVHSFISVFPSSGALFIPVFPSSLLHNTANTWFPSISESSASVVKVFMYVRLLLFLPALFFSLFWDVLENPWFSVFGIKLTFSVLFYTNFNNLEPWQHLSIYICAFTFLWACPLASFSHVIHISPFHVRFKKLIIGHSRTLMYRHRFAGVMPP